jgi:hypothetical protein
MIAHRIDLRPDLRPGGKKHGRTPMVYLGEVIGSSNDPEYAAARWLLDNGRAQPEDRLETYRGEMFCMAGIVGKLAKLTVVENKHGNPTFVIRPYMPISIDKEASRTAETPSGIHPDPELSEAAE